MGLFGLSWSWKRAVGLSAMKSRLSQKIGVPLTASGRQRKVGRIIERLLQALLVDRRHAASTKPGHRRQNPLGATFPGGLVRAELSCRLHLRSAAGQAMRSDAWKKIARKLRARDPRRWNPSRTCPPECRRRPRWRCSQVSAQFGCEGLGARPTRQVFGG